MIETSMRNAALRAFPGGWSDGTVPLLPVKCDAVVTRGSARAQLVQFGAIIIF